MESHEIMAILEDCELFQGLTSDEVEILVNNSLPKEFPTGKILYMKGEKSNDTFRVILSGNVDIVATGGRILRSMGPAEVIGEVALSDPNKTRTVNVIAKSPIDVLEWNVNHVKDKVPKIWKKLLKLAWKHISDYYEA